MSQIENLVLKSSIVGLTQGSEEEVIKEIDWKKSTRVTIASNPQKCHCLHISNVELRKRNESVYFVAKGLSIWRPVLSSVHTTAPPRSISFPLLINIQSGDNGVFEAQGDNG
ncbi:hypothetical protein L2E82_42882 [Cichorium intybus]|uniref:Uncharacterized protein n=1 Tax=Cichorium intybus TaxID=13427 RepID=A0ACB8ZMJ0_CICIN|nr:hypothetical protein L2E82_42882 [Cichorium intybus]